MSPDDLLAAARDFETLAIIEAERLADAELREIEFAKAEKAVLPANHWQARWRAEQKAIAASRLRLALEEALA